MPDIQLTEEESALTMRLLRLFAGPLEFVRFSGDSGEDVTIVLRGRKPWKRKKSLLVDMPDEALRKEFDESTK